MKIRAWIAVGLLLSATLLGQTKLRPGDLVAVCGDSITEQRLYSLFIEDYLLMCQPALKVDVVQFGWSGETSWGFLKRMENDVICFKPTVVTICYGMNDGGYTGPDANRLSQYRQAMDEIVKGFKAAGVRLIVVGSPGAVDTATFKRTDPNLYNQTLAGLTDVAKQIAADHKVLFADVHSAMLEAMANAKARFGWAYHVAGPDGFHPAANGHLVMAYAFLKALGCDGQIGTITLDMSTGKATATSGHKVIRSDKISVTVESSRYPFCFYGNPEDPRSTSGIIHCFDFNNDLNRFMLVVHNPPALTMKVTWGQQSKLFSSDSLSQGINLAAEFLDNPFSGPFKEVEQQVKKQQDFETTAVKQLIHTIPQWSNTVPEGRRSLEQFRQTIIAKDHTLRNQARSKIRPVRHTIVIEPQ